MKKIIMALSLCVFSFAAFAGEENNYKINRNGFEIKANTSKTVDKFAMDKSVSSLSIMAVEQGYILIKIEFKANCPGFSWYSTAAVLTIKVWDDGCVELYPWYEQSNLICS